MEPEVIFRAMESKQQYPTTNEIIFRLGMGCLLLGSVLMPGLGILATQLNKAKVKKEHLEFEKNWKKFNKKLLKRNLKRLKEQKIIEVVEHNGQPVVQLTQKGQVKYLAYKFQQLSFKGKSWDGKWRVVSYDVGKLKRRNQENLRKILNKINFYMLHKSVYLTPYKCQPEIEYLRQYLNLNEEVILLEVNKLENENFYKDYFGI